MRANQQSQYSTEMDISPPWSDKMMDTSKTPFLNLEIPSNIMDKQYEQYTEEQQIISKKDKVCKQLVSQIPFLNSLNSDKINEYYSGENNKFYDYEFMRRLGCMFKISFQSGDLGRTSMYDRVQSSLRELTELGSGVDGQTWDVDLMNISHLLLVKTPRNIIADLQIYHEFFVTTLCLNYLRSQTLCFEYIYGIFRCTKPELAEGAFKTKQFCKAPRSREAPHYGTNENILDIAMNDAPINYLMIENISDSITFNYFASQSENVTSTEILSSLVQLTFALDLALKKYEFCHYDLHDSNILMRDITSKDIKKNSYVLVHVEGGENFYLRTNSVPTIIDFGRSYVEYGHRSYGCYRYDIPYPDEARPLFDLYKLVGFLLYSLLSNDEKESNVNDNGFARTEFDSPTLNVLIIILEFFPHYTQLLNAEFEKVRREVPIELPNNDDDFDNDVDEAIYRINVNPNAAAQDYTTRQNMEIVRFQKSFLLSENAKHFALADDNFGKYSYDNRFTVYPDFYEFLYLNFGNELGPLIFKSLPANGLLYGQSNAHANILNIKNAQPFKK